MIYKNEIKFDYGYDGQDVITVYSKKEIDNETFQKMVEKAEKGEIDPDGVKQKLIQENKELFDLPDGADAYLQW